MLTELVNIGVGRAASMLNSMLHSHIQLRVPSITVLSLPELAKRMERLGQEPVSAVHLKFKGSFSGTAELIFPMDSASKLVDALTGDDEPDNDMDAIRTGTLTEVGNILLNGVLGSIGNVLKQPISYSIPNYLEGGMESLISADLVGQDTTILMTEAVFTVQEMELEGRILLIFEVGTFDALLEAINAFGEKMDRSA